VATVAATPSTGGHAQPPPRRPPGTQGRAETTASGHSVGAEERSRCLAGQVDALPDGNQPPRNHGRLGLAGQGCENRLCGPDVSKAHLRLKGWRLRVCTGADRTPNTCGSVLAWGPLAEDHDGLRLGAARRSCTRSDECTTAFLLAAGHNRMPVRCIDMESGDSVTFSPRAAARTESGAADPREETVYLRHRDEIYRYVSVLTGDPDAAADIVAETFARAVVAARADALPEWPLPWLLVTSRRLATDRWRRLKTSLTVRPLLARPDDHGIEEAEVRVWLTQICQVLEQRQREVIALRFVSDLSDRDIGGVMGISESGVRSLVSRALERLRQHPEIWR
jgi:RNA polymerase sigma-70 factor (ECF subfamily)